MTIALQSRSRSRIALFLALAVALVSTVPSRAAVAVPDSSGVLQDRFDYAVPDMPAFRILDQDPNSILRPGTRRALAAIVEAEDPRDFAIECAPFLLARDGEIALRDYQRRRWLYNLRVSLGARTPEGGPTRAALGLRLSLLDGADPYTNPPLLAAARAAAERIRDVRRQGADVVVDDLGSVRYAALAPAVRDSLVANMPPAARREFLHELGVEAFAELGEAQRESLITARLGPGPVRAVERGFEQARQHLETGSEWNRDILELGIAAAGETPDSAGRRVRAADYAAWLTGGIRLAAHGQLLVGGNGRLTTDEAGGALDRGAGGAALRATYGVNQARADMGFDVGWLRNARPAYGVSAGVEFRVVESIWVSGSLGLMRDGSGATRFTSSLSLRYALAGLIPGARAMGI